MTLTPSQIDGVDSRDEERALYYGAELIQECGILLRLQQVVMATAQILFQRFYLGCSLRMYSHIWAAAASLLLASKMEEESRKVRDIANVISMRLCVREQWRGTKKSGCVLPLDYYGAVGYNWKSEIINTERHMLRELGFHLHVEHPHKFILVFMNTIREQAGADDWLAPGGRRWHKVLQCAWNYGNDALRSQVVVVEAPETVACACIGLAATDEKVELPKEWYIVFGAEERDFNRTIAAIRRVYDVAKEKIRFKDIAECEIERICVPMRD